MHALPYRWMQITDYRKHKSSMLVKKVFYSLCLLEAMLEAIFIHWTNSVSVDNKPDPNSSGHKYRKIGSHHGLTQKKIVSLLNPVPTQHLGGRKNTRFRKKNFSKITKAIASKIWPICPLEIWNRWSKFKAHMFCSFWEKFFFPKILKKPILTLMVKLLQ